MEGPVLPNMDNLVRSTNRKRQTLRPQDPHKDDLKFVIDRTFVRADIFLVDDVAVDSARHLIIATRDQLTQLSRAKKWYMDGTFKVDNDPFYQLFSIHAFVKSGECVKQVPLAFVLMSRRTKQDYVKVLEAVLAQLEDPLVEVVMMDFEPGMWQGVRAAMPTVKTKGCVFHWTQRIYKKICVLGLSEAYKKKQDKYDFMRRLMALPFLPGEHFAESFLSLQDQANESNVPQLEELTGYVKRTWVEDASGGRGTGPSTQSLSEQKMMSRVGIGG